ncbi:hypothetical protein BDV3_002264 [Batrachochytrium dendrobatidis]|uniref:Uncharacterized protein n=2 Tax=Batrachochytrium dendrobatidis (strain JEL423) TaxID=403673 RepID=A0A177WWV9_BATDL|nr:hypothetical protein BDEG_27773 [Batrachochytrium dendrobatidis JEL423]
MGRGRTRISYILKDSYSSTVHTGGISALALDVSVLDSTSPDHSLDNSGILYTAGRDSSINSWNLHLTDSAHSAAVEPFSFAPHDSIPSSLPSRSSSVVPDTLINPNQPTASVPKTHSNDLSDSLSNSHHSSQISSLRQRPYPRHSATSARDSLDLLDISTSAKDGRRSVSFSKHISSAEIVSSPVAANHLLSDLGISQDYDTILNHNLRIFPKIPQSTFRRSFQHHSDWVNDIVLCNNNANLISCSSDRSIYMWNTLYDQSPVKIGFHTDCVKRLACSPQANFVVSGGLDRKIYMWDIQELRSKPRVIMSSESPNASIYSLACNPSGTVLVSGSPEKVVRVWDPRSASPQSLCLQGHTDNVRDLLVSHDGRWVLSASTDSTIKLWSLAMPSRCYTTYTHFDEAVWCLASASPTLSTFWAGCRDGHVKKLSRLPLLASTEETAETIAICKESSPVVRIAGIEDGFIWTATSKSSIHRWRDVPFRKSTNTRFKPTGGELIIPPGAMIAQSTDDLDPSGSFSVNINTLRPMDSSLGSIRLIPIAMTNDPEDDLDQEDDKTVLVWQDSVDVIVGAPAITKFAMLNNRRHVLALNTDGEVDMWDIIYCCKLKTFGKVDFQSTLQSENTVEWVANWCHIDTKIGVLTVHLEEGKCFDAEIYHEDLALPVRANNEDQRINLAKWVLTYLLFPYICAICPNDASLAHHLENLQKSGSSPCDDQQIHSPLPTKVYVSTEPHDFVPLQSTSTPTIYPLSSTPTPTLNMELSEESKDEYDQENSTSNNGSHEDDQKSNPPFFSDHEGQTGAFTETGTVLTESSSVELEAEQRSCKTDDSPFTTQPPNYPQQSVPHTLAVLPMAQTSNVETVALVTPAAVPTTLANIPSSTTTASTSNVGGSLMGKFKIRRRTNTGNSTKSGFDDDTADVTANAVAGDATTGLLVNTAGTAQQQTSAGTSNTAIPDIPKRRKWRSAAVLFRGISNASQEGSDSSTSTVACAAPTAAPTVLIPAPTNYTSQLLTVSETHVSDHSATLSSTFPNSATYSTTPVLSTGDASNYSTYSHSTTQPSTSSSAVNNPHISGNYLNYDLAPAVNIPAYIPIFISYEESPEASSYMDVFRGTSGDLGNPQSIKNLEDVVPTWLYEWIVMRRLPNTDPPKISFVLQPHPESKLSEMPPGNGRLTANRMLRIKKVMEYVAEKLQIQIQPVWKANWTSEGISPPPIKLEIYCNDVLISSRMSLATVKYHIWKSGGDVLLVYKEA